MKYQTGQLFIGVHKSLRVHAVHVLEYILTTHIGPFSLANMSFDESFAR